MRPPIDDDSRILVGAEAGGAEGALTEQFLTRIGARVRVLRTDQDLTVQELATRAGISRRLMTQIELGQANPSLVTVTRVARGLGAETTDLLSPAPAESPLLAHPDGSHMLVWSSERGSTAHLLESTRPDRTADLWRWVLTAGDHYQGHPDPPRSQELFYVLGGELTLTAQDATGDETKVIVSSGASARLTSDRSYTYRNTGPELCVFIQTVSLAR